MRLFLICALNAVNFSPRCAAVSRTCCHAVPSFHAVWPPESSFWHVECVVYFCVWRFPRYFSVRISSSIPLWLANTLCMTPGLLNSLRFVFRARTSSVLACFTSTRKGCVFCCRAECSVSVFADFLSSCSVIFERRLLKSQTKLWICRLPVLSVCVSVSQLSRVVRTHLGLLRRLGGLTLWSLCYVPLCLQWFPLLWDLLYLI